MAKNILLSYYFPTVLYEKFRHTHSIYDAYTETYSQHYQCVSSCGIKVAFYFPQTKPFDQFVRSMSFFSYGDMYSFGMSTAGYDNSFNTVQSLSYCTVEAHCDF